ncbi:MAG: FmdB family zinc ribbon protein [Bryobacteraceae bacterium]
MPLYEYQCDQCGDVFEVMQKFSDEPLQIHEKCGGPVRRLLSAPALQFKGSGWYITDYARGGGSAPNGKPDAAAPDAKKPAKEASSTKTAESPSTTTTPPSTSDRK